MRRIQRDTKHEDFVKSLTTGDNAIFRDIWRVLLFAAAYGVKQRARTPLQKVDSNKSMPDSYFGTPGWHGFLYLIGFLQSDSGEHLKKNDDQENRLISAFEEHANYGLAEMQRVVSSPSTALSDLVGLLLEVSIMREEKLDIEDLI